MKKRKETITFVELSAISLFAMGIGFWICYVHFVL